MAVHHSSLAALKRCPQKFKYAYADKLERKREALPLRRGLWLHSMRQADSLRRGFEAGTLLRAPEEIDVPGVGKPVLVKAYSGTLMLTDSKNEYPLTWKGMLGLLVDETYAWMPDEAKAEYAEDGVELPDACRLIMRGYQHYWRKELAAEKVLLVEEKWERLDTSGAAPVEYAGRIDLILLDAKGRLTIRDWKTTKSLPDEGYRLRERQRVLYGWGAGPLLSELLPPGEAASPRLELDYLITRNPPRPKINKDGSLSKTFTLESKRPVNTTTVAFVDALREAGMDPKDHLDYLRSPHGDGRSFFVRKDMPLNGKVVNATLLENAQVAQLGEQILAHPSLAYRVEDRSCRWTCDFGDLCLGDLYGQDTSTIRKRDYQIRKALVDPLEDDDEE